MKEHPLTKQSGNIFIFLFIINYLTVCFSYYWVTKYIIDVNNSLRYEYLIGAMMATWFTSPVWFSLAIVGIVRKNNILLRELVHYEAPFLLQVVVIIFFYSVY